MSTNDDIWLSIVESQYPAFTKKQLLELREEAACNWWLGASDEKLATLFDQYVMMKNLRG